LVRKYVCFRAGAAGALGTGAVTVALSGLLVMAAYNAMDSGATLNLPDDTTPTLVINTRVCEVGGLTLNSVAQPNGLYNASAYDWMGGSGRLCVCVPAPAAGTLLAVRQPAPVLFAKQVPIGMDSSSKLPPENPAVPGLWRIWIFSGTLCYG